MKRVRDASARQEMLTDLKMALNCPELVARCIDKAGSSSVYGFGQWLRYRRRCKLCGRQLHGAQLKFCSAAHGRVFHKIRSGYYRRQPFQQFRRSVQKVIRVDEKISAEAYQRLEQHLAAGRINAYRRKDGRLGEVGVPRVKPGGQTFPQKAGGAPLRAPS